MIHKTNRKTNKIETYTNSKNKTLKVILPVLKKKKKKVEQCELNLINKIKTLKAESERDLKLLSQLRKLTSGTQKKCPQAKVEFFNILVPLLAKQNGILTNNQKEHFTSIGHNPKQIEHFYGWFRSRWRAARRRARRAAGSEESLEELREAVIEAAIEREEARADAEARSEA